VAIMSPMTTGTALTEASAAIAARRGSDGTTTVNSTVHTATQECPITRSCDTRSSPVVNSATAIP
jgi:hypothetical protein